tara:strand:+ start:583 stop:753 length:171 start_codon:yes stop_codon:yes gene_type:complete
MHLGIHVFVDNFFIHEISGFELTQSFATFFPTEGVKKGINGVDNLLDMMHINTKNR